MLGYIGELSAAVRAHFDLKAGVTVAEIDFGMVMAQKKPHAKFKSLPRFPEVARDLAIVVDEVVHWGDLERVIGALELPLLENVTFASVFRGKQLGPGKKSIAFSMTFRAADRTLTGEEADTEQSKILDAISKESGAELRQ